MKILIQTFKGGGGVVQNFLDVIRTIKVSIWLTYSGYWGV